MEFAHDKLRFLESRKVQDFQGHVQEKDISSLITVSSYAGEYSADNAWDFKELEDAITKNYF
ncbi:hypothetical protein CFP56_028975 [Quercus suber]|uniref:Uncharacterized protein n=1 Tax=Quercus suber TaxID=58331 RepID=A0AAW0JT15_QUESU